jgi:hypothetical protein
LLKTLLESNEKIREMAEEDKKKALALELAEREKAQVDAQHQKTEKNWYITICVLLVMALASQYAIYWYFRPRRQQSKYLWDFNGDNFSKLFWESRGAFFAAKLPETHGFYTTIEQLVKDYGGQNCDPQCERHLSGVTLIRNWNLIGEFEGCLNLWGRQREEDPEFFRMTRAKAVGDDPQKDEVLKRFETVQQRAASFFREEPEGGMALLATFHGTDEAAAKSIAAYGAKDLRGTDPGYAGAGIYTTIQAEYAARYSDLSRSGCMVLCAVAVGNVYPISRCDYESPYDAQYYKEGGRRTAAHSKFYDGTNQSGFALKPRYDAHWFTVHAPRHDTVDAECYMPGDDRFPACFDEVVVKEEKQVLPIAILEFERAPNGGKKVSTVR